MAKPACRPSSSAMARSSRVKLRLDSAEASTSAPSVLPCAAIGTIIAERGAIARSISRWSRSLKAASSISSVMPEYSSERPVRMTWVTPRPSCRPNGNRRRYSRASSTFSAFLCTTSSNRSGNPSLSAISTPHQSAIVGTASWATAASVASYSRDEASSALASERKALRRLSASASSRALRSKSMSRIRSNGCSG